MTFIHDSLLTGYTVDGTNRTIVLHTQPHQGGGTVPIDVIFSGVVAYHFEGDCFCNTVFDIEEVPSARIIGEAKRSPSADGCTDGRGTGTPAGRLRKSSSREFSVGVSS